jgi:hypothetical protein
MELAFATIELRGLCESRKKASGVIGVTAARELEQRIAELVACDSVAEFDALFPQELLSLSPAMRAIRLRTGYDLVFCSGHVKTPTTSIGTDWTKVTRIRIMSLEVTNA